MKKRECGEKLTGIPPQATKNECKSKCNTWHDVIYLARVPTGWRSSYGKWASATVGELSRGYRGRERRQTHL